MIATNANRSLQNIIARAERFRATGRWPPWRWFDTPGGVPKSSGWAKEFRRVAENGVFVVLVREVDTEWGTLMHAMLNTPPGGGEPTWAEKQRIKDELFGRDRIAVEVFPRRRQVIDGAASYHLWVLPHGMDLPFGLHLSNPDTTSSEETDHG